MSAPIPGGSRWAAAFGSLLLFTFVLQVVTGILLTTCYAPSVGAAWQSVKYIQDEAPLGGFIRGMHRVRAATTFARPRAIRMPNGRPWFTTCACART
jgi:quinol-cytochrome oxidoreductase complex cytochrome b subunit